MTQASTAFGTHRGGSATLTLAGGAATLIAANQQVVITGTESPRVETGAAPALIAWDRWNYQRTDYLLQPASTRYVSPAVYGGETLNQYGSWRQVEWTRLDDAPWGWAPYHYGRSSAR